MVWICKRVHCWVFFCPELALVIMLWYIKMSSYWGIGQSWGRVRRKEPFLCSFESTTLNVKKSQAWLTAYACNLSTGGTGTGGPQELVSKLWLMFQGSKAENGSRIPPHPALSSTWVSTPACSCTSPHKHAHAPPDKHTKERKRNQNREKNQFWIIDTLSYFCRSRGNPHFRNTNLVTKKKISVFTWKQILPSRKSTCILRLI